MRAIIQRVTTASVSVDSEVISTIGKGLCVLIGISRNDKATDADYLVKKLLNLRIFEDEKGKRWCCSVKEKQLEILCVSQFTLYSVLKGNKPDFHLSMGSDQSQLFYEEFITKLRTAYKPELVKDGIFGAYMQVSIQNDGPVTITLDSPIDKTAHLKENESESKQKEN